MLLFKVGIIYEEVFVMNGIATVFTSGEIEAPVKE